MNREIRWVDLGSAKLYKYSIQTHLLFLLQWCKHIIDYFPCFSSLSLFFSSIIHAFGCQGFRHNCVTERVLTLPFSRMGRGVVRTATCMSPCARILVSKPRGHISASQTVTFIKGKAFNKIAVISKVPTILWVFFVCFVIFFAHSPNPYNLPTSVLSYLTY